MTWERLRCIVFGHGSYPWARLHDYRQCPRCGDWYEPRGIDRLRSLRKW